MTMLIVLAALQTLAAGNQAAPAPSIASGVHRPVRATPPTTHIGIAAQPTGGAGVATTPASTVAAVSRSGEITVPPSATPRPSRAQVLAAVRAEWGRFDPRGSGKLGPLQFSTWVLQANGARVATTGARNGAGIKPISAMNVTARAFARADANHDGGVTPDEMADFLMR